MQEFSKDQEKTIMNPSFHDQMLRSSQVKEAEVCPGHLLFFFFFFLMLSIKSCPFYAPRDP